MKLDLVSKSITNLLIIPRLFGAPRLFRPLNDLWGQIGPYSWIQFIMTIIIVPLACMKVDLLSKSITNLLKKPTFSSLRGCFGLQMTSEVKFGHFPEISSSCRSNRYHLLAWNFIYSLNRHRPLVDYALCDVVDLSQDERYGEEDHPHVQQWLWHALCDFFPLRCGTWSIHIHCCLRLRTTRKLQIQRILKV